jgi:gluconate 2-dehydrogenase gamma chain
LIRRSRPTASNNTARLSGLPAWREGLVSRRRFLIQTAGGSVALLFGLNAAASAKSFDPWPTLDAVLKQLLPSEPDSPGATEIHALDYLRFVVGDPRVDRQQRDFILQGNQWLDDLAREQLGQPFTALDAESKDRLLRQVTQTAAGENWLSTLLSYLLEALLTAPAYGGNTDRLGWRWLEYVPGFPLPGPGTRYPELPL